MPKRIDTHILDAELDVYTNIHTALQWGRLPMGEYVGRLAVDTSYDNNADEDDYDTYAEFKEDNTEYTDLFLTITDTRIRLIDESGVVLHDWDKEDYLYTKAFLMQDWYENRIDDDAAYELEQERKRILKEYY